MKRARYLSALPCSSKGGGVRCCTITLLRLAQRYCTSPKTKESFINLKVAIFKKHVTVMVTSLYLFTGYLQKYETYRDNSWRVGGLVCNHLMPRPQLRTSYVLAAYRTQREEAMIEGGCIAEVACNGGGLCLSSNER